LQGENLHIFAMSLLAAAPAEHVSPVTASTRSRISLAMDKGETQDAALLLLPVLLLLLPVLLLLLPVLLLLLPVLLLPLLPPPRTSGVTSRYASSRDMASKSGSYVLSTCSGACRRWEDSALAWRLKRRIRFETGAAPLARPRPPSCI
jgi:hypothetical protein